ncbi:MAG TPA: hypothetical protein VGQ60_04150 [Nitrospiraceae bacterium]|jgi:hypothetical protein|nr:hypothetical protein [Nitrospiraceae bacterium]
MKPSPDEQIDRLEQALRAAHEQRDTPRLSAHWQESLMREIRRQPAVTMSLLEAPRLIWRAAAVIALVSALLVGSALTWNADRVDADSVLFADASLDSSLLGEP